MKNKTKVVVENLNTGEKVYLLNFKRQELKKINETHVLASKIATNNILSKKEIETLFSQNILKGIFIKGKLYITKISLEEYLIFQKISKKINNKTTPKVVLLFLGYFVILKVLLVGR